MKEIEINIGDEFDVRLWEVLRSVIKDLGGQICEEKWGMAGSQELESFKLELEGSVICIESETYIGLTVTGDSYLVEKIQRLVTDRMNY
jgi:hypothetical protein